MDIPVTRKSDFDTPAKVIDYFYKLCNENGKFGIAEDHVFKAETLKTGLADLLASGVVSEIDFCRLPHFDTSSTRYHVYRFNRSAA